MLFNLNVCASRASTHAKFRVGCDFRSAVEPSSTVNIVKTVESAVGAARFCSRIGTYANFACRRSRLRLERLWSINLLLLNKPLHDGALVPAGSFGGGQRQLQGRILLRA